MYVKFCFYPNLLFLTTFHIVLFLIVYFFFCLTFCVGLAHHICNLLTETVALFLEADDKSSTKTENALLLSLLDILHCMLVYTANIVRQTLQVWNLFAGVITILNNFLDNFLLF